ncbi:MAG: MFS transporter [Deltaproteobacteria bacterium]|nr:MFS transporter [Deltaproteobacteria bacterium]
MLQLLRTRRFGPLFRTQLLGAFADNLLKSALVAALAFGGLHTTMPVPALINIATALLVLPFFLFGALAGQLADRFDKARMVRVLKTVEVLVLGLALVGFVTESAPLLFVALFGMGTQSAFFGPLKYALLPEHLEPEELVAGNALVELGTFVAILVGTLVGTLAGAAPGAGSTVGLALVAVALLGLYASRAIPAAPPSASIAVDLRPVRSTIATLRLGFRDRATGMAIGGVTLFWAIGALVLGQLPTLATDLGWDEHGLSLLLAGFSVGIGIGAALCERWSHGRVERGYVLLAALGMALGLAGLAIASTMVGAMIAVLVLGVAGGFYAVPLQALLQRRAKAEERARVIAANNIVNAAGMVFAAGGAALATGAAMSAGALLAIASVVVLLVTAFAAWKWRCDLIRVVTRALVHVLYRVDAKGLERIPEEGAALIVANHLSFVDAFVLGCLLDRNPRFVMDHQMFRLPVISLLFRAARAIPIAPRKKDPKCFDAAFEAIDEALANGELVMIFPEGKCTRDGELDTFKSGMEHILERRPVPVIPVGLGGLWGSVFSYDGGYPMTHLPKRFRSRVTVRVGDELPPTVSAEQARAAVVRQIA